ncbi:MAG: hypothetical protein FJ100_23415 [Deltaproteobacteria bacterium]|nr:hypothetical protein [Deltaproteobacteria bacterium]
MLLAWKEVVAISSGSACTSSSYSPSHVLVAMGLPKASIDGALRLSWSHLTPDPDVAAMADAIRTLR